MCVHACSVASDVLRPHGLYPPGSSVHGISQARILGKTDAKVEAPILWPPEVKS